MANSSLNLSNSWGRLFDKVSPNEAFLDGVRAVATLMVIMLHCVYGALLVIDDDRVSDWVNSAPAWLGWAFQARGADIIFLVSALLVTEHLLKNKEKQGEGYSVKHFYWSRFWRIYPLFLLAMGLYLLQDGDRWYYWWSNLLFVTNIVPEQKHIIPVGWSITLQMQFYLLLPLLLGVVMRMPKSLWIMGGLVVASVVLRAVVYFSDSEIVNTPFYLFYFDDSYPSQYGELMYYNLLTRLTPFLMGVFLGLYFFARGGVKKQGQLSVSVSSLLLFVCMLVCVLSTCLMMLHQESSWLYQDFNAVVQGWVMVLHRPVFSLGIALLILLGLKKFVLLQALSWFFCWSGWRCISQMIYPIYLFHMIAIALSAMIIFQGDRELMEASFSYMKLLMVFLLAVPLSVLLALPFYLFVERPCIV